MIALFTGIYNGIFHPSADEVDKVSFFTKEEIETMIEKLAPKRKQSLKESGIL